MPRLNAARKSESAPASQTRPKLAPSRPSPMDEPLPDFEAGRDAARLADDLDNIRVKLAEFEREREAIEVRLIEAMKAAKKKNLGTLHGRVTFLEKTEDKQVLDLDAAVALLEKHGIPLPPTIEVWIARHSTEERPLIVPTKTKKGMPDRIKFELNK